MTPSEQSMYGCNMDAFTKSVENSLTFKMNGIGMVIAGLMSDAQEELHYGDTESARKTLNRAKALLFETINGKYQLTTSPAGWAVAET